MPVNPTNSNSYSLFHQKLAQTIESYHTPQINLEAVKEAATSKNMQTLLDPEDKNESIRQFDEVRGFVSQQTALKEPLNQTLLGEWDKTLRAHHLMFKVQQALQQHSLTPSAALSESEGDAPAALSSEILAEQTAQLKTLLEGLNQLAQQSEGNEDASTLKQHCENITQKLNQVQNALAKRVQTEQLSDQAEEGHGHHHGGGAIIVDLDEAIHGLYAAISYMAQSIKGGGTELMRQFVAETQQMHEAPMEWMQHTVMPHGSADFGVSLGVAGILTPFALMAIKAGIEEMMGATHTHQELNERLQKLEARAAYLNPLAKKFPAGSLPAVTAMSNQQEIADTTFSKKQNRDGGLVGAFSFSSGASIASKMGMESIAKIIGFTGGAVAPAVGVASTFALGPAAAVSATGLGGYMVHKSQKKAAAFRAEEEATHRHIDNLMEHINHQPQLKNYSQFLDQKMAQHKHFFNNYRDWNRGFLAGSGIYTAGTLAKVGVGAAALAGTMSDPSGATPIVLLALIAAGGMVMGASSHQFFSGHGRHHRYEGYHREDDMELNRRFLSSVDLLNLNNDENSLLAGFRLRADFHQHIAAREELRQDFLQDVAGKLGRHFTGQYTWTADTPDVVEKRGEKPGKRQTLKNNLNMMKKNGDVRLSSAASFARHAAKGHLTQGKESAREIWNSHRPALSKTQLQRYMATGSDKVRSSLTQLMQSTLQGQIAFSAAKREAKLNAYNTLSNHAQGINLDNKEEAHQMQALLVQLEHDLHQDHQWHSQLLAVDNSLRNSSSDAHTWSQTIDRFVTLQSGKPFDPEAAVQEEDANYHVLAGYLLNDAPARYRDLRGKLLETELESTRLKEVSEQLITPRAQAESATDNV